jgi:hypothetical protein
VLGLTTIATTRWDVTDAESVLTAILDQPLCVPCIAERAGVAQARVESILEALGPTLQIGWMRWSCAACKEPGDIYRLC